MDGWKNAINEKEPKTDKKSTIKKSEVKLKQALIKDVTPVPADFVLQKDRTDGPRSPPEADVRGVPQDASATTDIRSRPGGWSVDVCGPNAASSSGQLHTGKSVSAAPKNCQPDPVTESTAVRPAPRCPAADINAAALEPAPRSPASENIDEGSLNSRFSAADIKDRSATPPKPAPRSPVSEYKDSQRPDRHFPTADIKEKPAAFIPAPRSPAPENKDVPLKPAQRPSPLDPQETLSPAPTPAPRSATKDAPPKPARRSAITKRDAQSGTAPQFLPTTGNSDTQNAPKPAPRSSASLRSSPPDDAARIESRSNHQFIADENVSIWSSSVQIDRPSSTSESICRICHESDHVEPLISPCLCRGTLSLVHRTCLQHWLAESDSSSCELCRFIYITKRVPKYSILGSVVAWIKQNRRQRKALLMDTLGMIAFVPLATMITYVAAALADGIEYQESPSWTDVTIRFAIVTFISLMTTIDVAYATYWMLRAQHHFSTWYSWYRRNSDVTLLPHSQQ